MLFYLNFHDCQLTYVHIELNYRNGMDLLYNQQYKYMSVNGSRHGIQHSENTIRDKDFGIYFEHKLDSTDNQS